MPKIIRVTTVPISLRYLLKGQLRFINENGFEVLAVSSPGEDLKFVEKCEQVRTHSVFMRRNISPLTDFRSLLNLYFLFIREKPEIVHSHTPKAGLLSMLAAWFAGVPIRIHTVAGLPLMEKKGILRLLLVLCEKATSILATEIFVNSFTLRNYMVSKRLVSLSKSSVILNGSSNGIDLEYFNPDSFSVNEIEKSKNLWSIGKDDFVFLFVGRIVRDKGIQDLLDSFMSFRDSINKDSARSCKLLLVGSFESKLDPLDASYIDLIKTNENIIHTDFTDDVRIFYLISDCLIFPSYREGFPNVLLQSLAMNLPVIATNINGCNEIVDDGVNGLLFPVREVEILKSLMLNIFCNVEFLNSLKYRSRVSVLNRYDNIKYWSELLNIYNRLVLNL